MHGPTRHGATFLATISTKMGKYCQLYTLSRGPMRLWSLSTTAEDRKMRQIFYANFSNHQEARQALAFYFPEGGCKKIIDSEKQRLQAESAFDNDINLNKEDDNASSIVEEIAKDCINDYFNRIAKFK